MTVTFVGANQLSLNEKKYKKCDAVWHHEFPSNGLFFVIFLYRWYLCKSRSMVLWATGNLQSLLLSGENKNRPGARFTNDFFARNSNSMETSRCCNSVAGHQIATNFCTCHDSTAVVPCTKFCSDHCIRIEMRVKRNFLHRIWIAMEKPLLKRGPRAPLFQFAPCHGIIRISVDLLSVGPFGTNFSELLSQNTYIS